MKGTCSRIHVPQHGTLLTGSKILSQYFYLGAEVAMLAHSLPLLAWNNPVHLESIVFCLHFRWRVRFWGESSKWTISSTDLSASSGSLLLLLVGLPRLGQLLLVLLVPEQVSFRCWTVLFWRHNYCTMITWHWIGLVKCMQLFSTILIEFTPDPVGTKPHSPIKSLYHQIARFNPHSSLNSSPHQSASSCAAFTLSSSFFCWKGVTFRAEQ